MFKTNGEPASRQVGILGRSPGRRLLVVSALTGLALALTWLTGRSCWNRIRFWLSPSSEFEYHLTVLRNSGTEWSIDRSEEAFYGPERIDNLHRTALLGMSPKLTVPLFLERLADPTENIKVREVACEGLCTYEMWRLAGEPELKKQRFIRSFFLVLWRLVTENQEPARLTRGVDSKLSDMANRHRAVLAGDPETGKATWLRALCDASRPAEQRIVALSILDAMRQDVVQECMALLRASETPPLLRVELYGYLRHFSGRQGFGLPKDFEEARRRDDRNTQEAWWMDARNVELASKVIQEWFETHQDAVRTWVSGRNPE